MSKLAKPEKLSDVTLEFMSDYVIKNHPNDIEWLKKLIQENKKTDGDNKTRSDIRTIRKVFCEKHFPALIEKANEKPKTKAELIIEKLDKASTKNKK